MGGNCTTNREYGSGRYEPEYPLIRWSRIPIYNRVGSFKTHQVGRGPGAESKTPQAFIADP